MSKHLTRIISIILLGALSYSHTLANQQKIIDFYSYTDNSSLLDIVHDSQNISQSMAIQDYFIPEPAVNLFVEKVIYLSQNNFSLIIISSFINFSIAAFLYLLLQNTIKNNVVELPVADNVNEDAIFQFFQEKLEQYQLSVATSDKLYIEQKEIKNKNNLDCVNFKSLPFEVDKTHRKIFSGANVYLQEYDTQNTLHLKKQTSLKFDMLDSVVSKQAIEADSKFDLDKNSTLNISKTYNTDLPMIENIYFKELGKAITNNKKSAIEQAVTSIDNEEASLKEITANIMFKSISNAANKELKEITVPEKLIMKEALSCIEALTSDIVTLIIEDVDAQIVKLTSSYEDNNMFINNEEEILSKIKTDALLKINILIPKITEKLIIDSGKKLAAVSNTADAQMFIAVAEKLSNNIKIKYIYDSISGSGLYRDK